QNSHNNSIAMDDLVSWMKRLNSKYLMVIMDACFSGLAAFETKGFDRATMSSIEGPAKYLMMAGKDDESSLADRRWNGSLFTEMISRGVQSARFSGQQNDRIVFTHALYSWVRQNVSYEAQRLNPPQRLTPLLQDLEGASKGEFIFFR